jgi:predicted nucleic acid-binding protein
MPPASRDLDDDHALACALAADANLIVSGDRDLFDLHEYQGITTATTDALQRLEVKITITGAGLELLDVGEIPIGVTEARRR